jgi:hypothetical protein
MDAGMVGNRIGDLQGSISAFPTYFSFRPSFELPIRHQLEIAAFDRRVFSRFRQFPTAKKPTMAKPSKSVWSSGTMTKTPPMPLPPTARRVLAAAPAELKPARKNPTVNRLRISIFRFALQDLLSFHEKKMLGTVNFSHFLVRCKTEETGVWGMRTAMNQSVGEII